MIKLSKIKIVKRIMLSALALTFLSCGAYMATKMISNSQVNAADPASTTDVQKVTIASNPPWVYYHYLPSGDDLGTDRTTYNLSTPRISVTEYDGTTVDYDSYCIDPGVGAPSGEYDRVEMKDENADGSLNLTNAMVKLAIYMSSVNRDTANKFSQEEKNVVDPIMNSVFNASEINTKWHQSVEGAGYPNVESTATEGGMPDFKYLFMHLTIGYIYHGLSSETTTNKDMYDLYHNIENPRYEEHADAGAGGWYMNSYDLSFIANFSETLRTSVVTNSDVWAMAKNYALYGINTNSGSEASQTQNVVWIEDGNPEYGNIKVEKCDSETRLCGADGEAGQFEGVTFTVANNSAGRIYAPEIQNTNLGSRNAGTHFFDPGEVLAIGTTGSNGTYTFEKLPLNVEYLVTEVSSNDGYIAVASPQTTTIITNGATNTLKFYNDGVKLDTTAKDGKDGDKIVTAEKDATIIDTIEYCLKAGTEYTFNGILMDKTTGESVKIDGQPITATVTTTPETNCGTVDMEFKFDATGLGGTEVVVFETVGIIDPVTGQYTLVASHEDLKDDGQTIKIVDKAPETGFFTNIASSDAAGGVNILVVAVAGVSALGIGGYLIARATAKKRFMSRR